MSGTIDIVVNLYTPQEVKLGQTGLDENFKEQVRMPKEMRGGVSVDQYLEKMDTAGIERSLLIAVRAGDIRMPESFEVPYERVHEVCTKHPERFSGLAGIDPFRGMSGLKDLEKAVNEFGFVGAHLYPHWCELPPDHRKYYPYYAKCCELNIPIMMQVGHNLIYSKNRRTAGDAYAPKYWPKSFVHYANSYGSHKVMFGTDWPVIDPIRAIEEVDNLNLKEESKQLMLRDNAIKVFNLD